MSNEDLNDICTDSPSALSMVEMIDSSAAGNTRLKTTSFLRPTKVVHVSAANKYDDTSPSVTISRAEFDQLLTLIDSKDRKLQAISNIHMLIREKEEEITSLKNKNQTYADALMVSELRQCHLVKLVAKQSRDNLHAAVVRKGVGTSSNEHENNTTDSQSPTALGNAASDVGKDLQNTDHGTSSCLSDEEIAIKKNCLETDEASFEGRLDFVEVERRPKGHQEKSVHLCKRKTLTCDFPEKNLEQLEGHKPGVEEPIAKSKTAGPPRVVGLPLKVSGVSQELVSKLMQQNARLKQVLRQVMSSRGIGMEDYLEKQEYESVVEQLRQELRLSQLREKNLDQLIASIRNSDNEEITKRNLHLEELVNRQNRALFVKQAMIDAFSKRCEQLEMKLKEERAAGATRSSQDQQVSKQGTVMAVDTSQSAHQQMLIRTDLVTDGDRDTAQACNKNHLGNNTLSTKPSSKQFFEDRCAGSMLICERCEREFDMLQKEAFLEHCKKCTDD